MSGHNKWSKVKRGKEKTDVQKSKIYTKIGRELSIIAKSGGTDLNSNNRLKDAISKARKINMPSDAINRAINRAATSGDNFEEVLYEGYANHGVGVIVSCLTDNRNRTAGDLRYLFDKFGAGLGMPNSVSFMFNKTGIAYVTALKEKEDEIFLFAIENGATDILFDDEEKCFLVFCEAGSVYEIENVLRQFGETESEVIYKPNLEIELASEQFESIEKLVDALENLDDVQNVYINAK